MVLAADKTKVSTYMNKEIVRKLRVLAAMDGQSVSGYLESLAKREIEQAQSKGIKFGFSDRDNAEAS
jgi:hypothetical protein